MKQNRITCIFFTLYVVLVLIPVLSCSKPADHIYRFDDISYRNGNYHVHRTKKFVTATITNGGLDAIITVNRHLSDTVHQTYHLNAFNNMGRSVVTDVIEDNN